MNQTRKIAALLMAAMMTIPAVSCKKNPNPGAEGSTQPQESETLQLNTDEAKNIQMDLAFKEVEGIIENAENPEETQPSVSISQGEDGSLYVQKTDINHQVVTQENGDAATELYTGTTLATKVPSPEYQPSYKTYFSMWLDMTNKSDFVFDGEFLTFKIKISEDAQDGVYPIQLYRDDFSNYEGKTLRVTKNPGYICVNSDAPSPVNETGGDLTLTGGVVSGKPGDTVDFTINTVNNPGFVGFRLWMSYDANIFRITKAAAGKDFETKAKLTNKTVGD